MARKICLIDIDILGAVEKFPCAWPDIDIVLQLFPTCEHASGMLMMRVMSLSANAPL